ncbi:M28 family metallopeptidase [Alteromonadaceae bacterium BrNp21-10]|nr:M28 family metallopeptidase [Alteromonadaceae bacterium BrNp21-10]
MPIKSSILIIATLGCLAACSPPAPQEQSPAPATPAASNLSFEQAYQNVSDDALREYTRIISADEFEGRLPTTVGETKMLALLTAEFDKLGATKGTGDSYLQAVELTEITADPNMSLRIGGQTLMYKEHMVASTKHEKDQVTLDASDVVFVGYGINAPEYDWNDYANIDVKGKTVIILVNDPGFENPDSGKFQGTTMTYYGRWTYKYEEASRQGAAAAFIIHETEPASYGWSVVANSWSGPQYGLVSPNGNADRVSVEGWLMNESAQNMFLESGFYFEKLKAKALQGPFSQDLGIKASITINSTSKQSTSYNFLATIPGSERPDEHIMYTAHWDHLGKDTSLEGDQIYNGAHDNATGVAASIEMAKAFASLDKKPARSVSFLLVTAEEQGLLGSQYYAEHPVIPLAKTVANLNMDALNILGKTEDVKVIGRGKSELEDYLQKAAKRQHRYLVDEDRPQAGSYYRSDHFNFAKQGVPALNAKGGSIAIDEETAQYRKRTKVIVTGCYHQVCDQFREKWDFSGIQEDTQMLFEVGYDIANDDKWPQWSATSEFQRR